MSVDCETQVQHIDRLLAAREPFGMRFGLDRMERLLDALGRPQLAYRTVHVVGTNGKTSTTTMIAALLKAHGLKVGAYTSPHLVSFNERIAINGESISDDEFLGVLERVEGAARELDALNEDDDDQITQYELLTAAAFLAFQRAGIEIAVIEAGLGGRLDATNTLESEIQVLTNVDLDHTELLGGTVGEIAREKLAVVPSGGKLFVGNGANIESELAEVEGRGVEIVLVNTANGQELTSLVAYQRTNLVLAERVAAALLGPLDDGRVAEALEQLTVVGRFQLIDSSPDTIVDGAHNPAAMRALVETIKEMPQRPRLLVLSMFEDKDVVGAFEAMTGVFDGVYATSNSDPRAHSAESLAVVARATGLEVEQTIENPAEALSAARRAAGPGGLVVAAGSLTLVGDLKLRLR